MRAPALLRTNRDFRLLWIGESVSELGTTVTQCRAAIRRADRVACDDVRGGRIGSRGDHLLAVHRVADRRLGRSGFAATGVARCRYWARAGAGIDSDRGRDARSDPGPALRRRCGGRRPHDLLLGCVSVVPAKRGDERRTRRRQLVAHRRRAGRAHLRSCARRRRWFRRWAPPTPCSPTSPASSCRSWPCSRFGPRNHPR